MYAARVGTIICLISVLTACGGGASSSAPLVPLNVAPVANAGGAQAILLGATVTLDGSASVDANGDALSYSWTLSAKPSGSNAVLTAAASVHPTLTPDVGGSYSASLIVNDGKTTSATATVTITVTPPTDPSYYLAGGENRTIATGTTTSIGLPPWALANGDKLSYSWTLSSKPAGSNATLVSANAARASVTPDLPGSYVASLIVSDGKRLSLPALTTVNALDATAFEGFVGMSNNGSCNDVASDLYLIDGKYVFSNIAGSCGDASYSAGLYGLTPAQSLCSIADSIVGRVRNCPDASIGALFDMIYTHRNERDLGLGSTHQVSKFIKPAPVPDGASAVGFTVIDQGGSHSPFSFTASTAIVRTDAEWASLWQAHKGNLDAPVRPPVDFSKKIVLALFYPQISFCVVTSVTNVYVSHSKLVVEYMVRATAAPDSACTTIAYSAAELISVDIAADPSLQIVFQQKNIY